MDTKVWGPAGWVFLHTITFNYPQRIDLKNREHAERKKYTRELFLNLQYTLPCKYCRASLKKFYKELPLTATVLGSRERLTYWFYEIHNKVNEKLRRQELEAVQKHYDMLEGLVESGGMTWHQARNDLEHFVVRTMITGPDPSFEEVCKKYESFRAGCHADAGSVPSCRAPVK
jgi:hypothetical protein